VSRVNDGDDASSGHTWQSVNAEVTTLCQLNHPNIIRIYKSFREGDLFIPILEFCPGGDLQDLIDQTGGLSSTMFADVGSQIVKALLFCHSHGIAHHDIKPSNILFDRYGRPKLADFGLAFEAHGLIDRRFAGSIVFEAPELLQKRPYDAFSCDIWALGITFLTMLQGGNPWGVTDPQAMRPRIVLGNYEIRKAMRREVALLIARMLSIDPLLRPTISEVDANPCFVVQPDAKRKPRESCMKMLRKPPILTPTKASSQRRGSVHALNRQTIQKLPNEFRKVQSFSESENP
jgi:serine/threonine protein kinase